MRWDKRELKRIETAITITMWKKKEELASEKYKCNGESEEIDRLRPALCKS